MRLRSAGATSASPLIRRVTLDGFFSSLWRFPAFCRTSLPEPVTLTRFPVPVWLFIFGMVPVTPLSLFVLVWCC
jgi:hypothetical protein